MPKCFVHFKLLSKPHSSLILKCSVIPMDILNPKVLLKPPKCVFNPKEVYKTSQVFWIQKCLWTQVLWKQLGEFLTPKAACRWQTQLNMPVGGSGLLFSLRQSPCPSSAGTQDRGEGGPGAPPKGHGRLPPRTPPPSGLLDYEATTAKVSPECPGRQPLSQREGTPPAGHPGRAPRGDPRGSPAERDAGLPTFQATSPQDALPVHSQAVSAALGVGMGTPAYTHNQTHPKLHVEIKFLHLKALSPSNDMSPQAQLIRPWRVSTS